MSKKDYWLAVEMEVPVYLSPGESAEMENLDYYYAYCCNPDMMFPGSFLNEQWSDEFLYSEEIVEIGEGRYALVGRFHPPSDPDE